ncbi:SGNH/GDSL hydrolase family protein [Salinibacterium sp. SYSU T00001]|uniref:SGNH/GDSL hydrolase family protein n=1 Tax=Homoserinimonas sedimenticola TaxID=2986805 RepID=UPI0022359714|nr:SGNH/GDSL hydrolase family protein [Salinibacterium sedimenticola]MCW4384609.1 SGNH/GDSL hydrolase family protein [Salinibacterium sedimenticola]
MTIRFVALGDSFTEGVGDPAPELPNGVRGWADRFAGLLARTDPDTSYANIAIRGRKLRQVVDEQVEPAIALEPTLVTIYAGGNDILRPSVDIDALMRVYDDAIVRLRAAGAEVVMFTGFDTVASALFRKTRPRTAIYNELVREIADERGAHIVDYWRFDEYDDPRMWDIDRLHMSSLGHANMARRVFSRLQADEMLQPENLGPLPVRRRLEAMRADAAWAREYFGPWIGRRLTGRSSGDGLSPRWPELRPVIPEPV